MIEGSCKAFGLSVTWQEESLSDRSSDSLLLSILSAIFIGFMGVALALTFGIEMPLIVIFFSCGGDRGLDSFLSDNLFGNL